MILYNIDNIRDLFGHKVSRAQSQGSLGRWCQQSCSYQAAVRQTCSAPLIPTIASSPTLQVSLSMVKKNAVCRLGL